MSTLTCLVVSLVLLVFSQLPNVEARKKAFTIELVHRDSPLSPFYDPLDTNSNRLRNAVLRSISRVNHFHLSASSELNSIQSDVIPNNGNYLMKLSIGTPRSQMLAVADTGSDLIWTQCNPCEQCFPQDAPIFDPQKSSTYKTVPCTSNYCQALPQRPLAPCGDSCEYFYSYVDQTYSSGELANETFTFDSTNGQAVSIPGIIFGCGHRNGGTFNSLSSGLVGLGGGPLSLVSQLSSEADGKFSYCLVPVFSKATSKLNFGSQAIISGNGAVSTPLISNQGSTFYVLRLEGVSFGNSRNDDIQNIIIDSGTTLTSLPEDLYTTLESAVQEAIKLEPVPDPTETFTFCYNMKGDDLFVPEMTFHFTGADVKLSQTNTFIRQTEELVCFTLAPTQSTPIFGNLAQVNFQVEYDLVGRKVSFAPVDCTKF